MSQTVVQRSTNWLTSEVIEVEEYLHHESLEADFLEGIGLVAVELQVVVEDQTVLHVTGHLNADRCGA